MNRSALLLLASTIGLSACSQLTGVQASAKAMCDYPAVDKTDTVYKFVTAAGDTVVLGVTDSTQHVIGVIWSTVRVQIPGGRYPCR